MGPKNLGEGPLGPRPIWIGCGWPVEIRPSHLCHVAKCGRSRSNRTSVITVIRRKNGPLCSEFHGHSRSSEPTRINRLSMTFC